MTPPSFPDSAPAGGKRETSLVSSRHLVLCHGGLERRGAVSRSRCRHAQLCQCRHRGRGEGHERDHGQEFRHRPAREGHGQYRLGETGVEGTGVRGVPVGAASPGLCGGGGTRHRQDRSRERRQAAIELCARTAGQVARRRRPDPDAGVHAEVRVGGATGADTAPADRSQQHHYRLPEQQLAGDHGLRQQPPAHREDHRLDRPAQRNRPDRDFAQARLGAGRDTDREPPVRRGAAAPGRKRGGSYAARDRGRGRALEQPDCAFGQSFPALSTAQSRRHAGFTHKRRGQYPRRVPEERGGGEGGRDAAGNLPRRSRTRSAARGHASWRTSNDRVSRGVAYDHASWRVGIGPGASRLRITRHHPGGSGDQLDHH